MIGGSAWRVRRGWVAGLDSYRQARTRSTTDLLSLLRPDVMVTGSKRRTGRSPGRCRRISQDWTRAGLGGPQTCVKPIGSRSRG